MIKYKYIFEDNNYLNKLRILGENIYIEYFKIV